MKKYIPDVLSTVLLLLVFFSDVFRDAPVMNVFYWIFAGVGAVFVAWSLFSKSLQLFEKLDISYYTGCVLLIAFAMCISFGIKALASGT